MLVISHNPIVFPNRNSTSKCIAVQQQFYIFFCGTVESFTSTAPNLCVLVIKGKGIRRQSVNFLVLILMQNWEATISDSIIKVGDQLLPFMINAIFEASDHVGAWCGS